jgi:hypothetical protein
VSNAKHDEVLIPEFIEREVLVLLQALKVHGGKLSIEDAATYLRISEGEVEKTALRLHRWKLARNYAIDGSGEKVLKMSQFGELALLEASGMDFDGYERQKQLWVEDWVYWYENYRD